MKQYILGIDMGESSLGWACINVNSEGEPVSILDAGVRIFPCW